MKTADIIDPSTIDGLADAAGDRAKSCVDAGVNAFNNATAKARQAGQSADGLVRANPWIAVGAAAGVGLLIGYLIRSRRDA